VVVQKDGILQRTFAYRAPDIDSSDAFTVNGLCLRVNDFAKRLGAGWAFQMEAQRFFTQEYPRGDFQERAPYLIDREREASFRSYGQHFESSYFITFTWKPPAENVKKLTALFVQSGSSAVEGAGKSIKENVDFFVNETNSIVGILAGDLRIAPLDNEGTAAYLHSSVSMNRQYIRFPATSILLDRILPDQALVTSLTMKLGEHYIPIIGINDFPMETYPAILDGLNRARVEYRWASRYVCLGKEEGAKEAKKKEKSHRGDRTGFWQNFFATTSGEQPKETNHGAGVKEGDSITAGIEIDTDQAALGYYTCNVMVWDTDIEEAKKKADAVKTVINSAGFTCKEETFNALEAWKSMLPGQVYANYRALPVLTYNLSHVVPLSSVWVGQRVNSHTGEITGVAVPHVTCSTAEGTPFFLNLNVGDVGHTAVLGPTGAGKSTLLNLLEMQFFKYPGSQVIVFDKGRSCRQPCLAAGGLFYEPAGENDAGIAFQPLRELETDRDLLNAIDFIESLFKVNNYPVIPPMSAAIKETLELLRGKPKSARTLTSFLQYVNYQDPETRRPVFKEQMGDYFWDGGKFGKIFDARSAGLSLDTRFLAVEMEALMNRGAACVIPALLYLFNQVEKKFDGRLTLLVLDEAWLFLKNEVFAEKIAEWFKVLRKKNVFVVFATQDVTDIEHSELQTTIVQQCLTKIYLADPSALTPAMNQVYRAFGLTDAEIAVLAGSVMKQDYFYTSPLGRRLFQLDLGELALALIGTADHAYLDALAREHGQGAPLGTEILAQKRIDCREFLGEDAPEDAKPAAPLRVPEALPPAELADREDVPAEPPAALSGTPSAADILAVAAKLPERKSRNGEGRAAEQAAERLHVGRAVIYRARKILKHGTPELIEEVTQGRTTIYAAYKNIKKCKIA
jgi:type IV secretion system protein VirB4